MPYLNTQMVTLGIKETDLDSLKNYGEFLASNARDNRDVLTTSKIRKFFGELRRIQATGKSSEVVYLIPKLAYDAGREKYNSRIQSFYKELEPLIKTTSQKPDEYFDNLVKVIESIIAFHKYFDGK